LLITFLGFQERGWRQGLWQASAIPVHGATENYVLACAVERTFERARRGFRGFVRSRQRAHADSASSPSR
jgi:hypothetical protein